MYTKYGRKNKKGHNDHNTIIKLNINIKIKWEKNEDRLRGEFHLYVGIDK